MDDFRSEGPPDARRPASPEPDPHADVPLRPAERERPDSEVAAFEDAWLSETAQGTEPSAASLDVFAWPPDDAQPASEPLVVTTDMETAGAGDPEWTPAQDASHAPASQSTEPEGAPYEAHKWSPAAGASTAGAFQPSMAPPPTSPAGSAFMAPRQMMMVALAIVLGGTATFAMLMSSRGPDVEPAVVARPGGTPASRTAPKGSTAASPAAPRWTVATRDWVGRQRNAAAFEVKAVNRVQAWQHQAHPILVVRCAGKQIEAFVFIESAAQLEAQDENHSVRVRFDDGAASSERWADSEEHDALFAPNGAAFARRLLASRTLHFGYTPHNSPAADVEFHVAGLRELMAPAVKACGATP